MADLSHVPTFETYREMLATAARIADEAKSVELFFILIVGGRRTLRAGAILHFNKDWYDAERAVIQIPEFEDCNCPLCKTYAKRKKANGDPRHEEQILEEDYWSPKSDAGARTIPLKTDREVEIVERFIDIHGSLDYSYGTLRHRVIRLAEVHPTTNAENWSPHLLRATAATHLLWSGFRHLPMKTLAGWGDHEYGEVYIKATGARVDEEFDRVLGEGDGSPEIRQDPPTWEELRPEYNSGDLLMVERWTPETTGEVEGYRYRDAEELYLDDGDPLESYQKGLDKFFTTTPTAAVLELAEQRFRVEREAAYYTDDVLDPSPQNAPMIAVAIALTAVGLAILNSWTPGVSASVVVGVGLGTLASIQRSEWNHPEY